MVKSHYQWSFFFSSNAFFDIIDITIFHAGTAIKDNQLVTDGGRVIAVSAIANTLREAVDKAYAGVKSVKFENMYYRNDIAHR
jgi:phosphoribosylamine--glycine ligase/phosphoribosylformylglycinamidine cyclo-ligase